MTNHDDRREHARRTSRFSIRLGEGAEAGEAFATEGLNISMGGVYCQVPHFIPVMTKLAANLLLPVSEEGSGPSEEMLAAEMVVVWSEPEAEIPGCETYQIGCAFLPLEPSQKETLQRHLDYLALGTAS